MVQAVPAPSPMQPFSCPRCFTQAKAQPQAQVCGSCGGTFVLRAGARVDPLVTPPPIDPRLPRIKTRAAQTFALVANIVAPEGVLSGTLDPVTGYIPLEQAGVLYTDIVSVAVWRKLDIVRIVLLALVTIPILLATVSLAISIPPVAAVMLPLLLLVVFGWYKLLSVKRNYARIAGTFRTLTVQFDSPVWKRRRFHDELLRRAGISPSPIP